MKKYVVLHWLYVDDHCLEVTSVPFRSKRKALFFLSDMFHSLYRCYFREKGFRVITNNDYEIEIFFRSLDNGISHRYLLKIQS